MKSRRLERVNSLLKEVLSEVIIRDLNEPTISSFVSITKVDTTRDLKYAKVYVSIIGDGKERENTIQILQKAAGFIAKIASKKIVLRYFPTLTFYLDETVEKQMKIEKLLQEIDEKKKN